MPPMLITISGEKYRLLYEERDGSFWYVPDGSEHGDEVRAFRFTREEIKEKFDQ